MSDYFFLSSLIHCISRIICSPGAGPPQRCQEHAHAAAIRVPPKLLMCVACNASLPDVEVFRACQDAHGLELECAQPLIDVAVMTGLLTTALRWTYVRSVAAKRAQAGLSTTRVV